MPRKGKAADFNNDIPIPMPGAPWTAARAAYLDAIFAVTSALPALQVVSGTITTDGTLQNVYINNAPAGLYRPVCCMIDMTNQTATETVEIIEWYRLKSGAAMIQKTLAADVEKAGVCDPLIIVLSLSPNRYGMKITIENTAIGTHRAYDWTVFYEAAP